MVEQIPVFHKAGFQQVIGNHHAGDVLAFRIMRSIHGEEPVMLEIMGYYKKYAHPGKRLDLVLRSHFIELCGMPVNRKIWTPLLALIIARKRAGGTLPPLQAE